jgi:hypothetical protein
MFQPSENLLKCTTQDEKDLVFIIVFFLPYILIPIKNNKSKISNIQKDYILDHYDFRFHHDHL